MKNLVVTEEIWREGNMYTAYCPELDVASCGRNVDEAKKISLRLSKFNSKRQQGLERSRNFYPSDHLTLERIFASEEI